MTVRIIIRNDTTENWEKVNPILGDGEFGIERCIDNSTKIKIGNGLDNWLNLKYDILNDTEINRLLELEANNRNNQINELELKYDNKNVELNLKIEEEIQNRETAISSEQSAREQQINTAISIEAQARQTQVNELNEQIQATNHVLDGVHTTSLIGTTLSRVLGGITEVPKYLFDTGIVFMPGKTLIFDTHGSTGVYIEDIDSATMLVVTKSISPVADLEPKLLGEVELFTDLPLTVTDAEELWGRTPRIDDYAQVMSDENFNGLRVEYYITNIENGIITWGNPVPLNTADFQTQTTAADAGLVLTGGAVPGTHGQSIPIDITVTENSKNLITSGAVNEALANMINAAMAQAKIDAIAPGKIGHYNFRNETDASQWRLMRADGRTISINDPRAERLLQYCLIPYEEAIADPNILGFYLTDDYFATKADLKASGKKRPTPAENGAYYAIPCVDGLFIRSAEENATLGPTDDTLYDGGVSGTFDKDRMLKHTHLQDAHNHIQNKHKHAQGAHSHQVAVHGQSPNNKWGLCGSFSAAAGWHTSSNTNTAQPVIEDFVATNNPETAVNQYSGDGDYTKPPSLSSVVYLSY